MYYFNTPPPPFSVPPFCLPSFVACHLPPAFIAKFTTYSCCLPSLSTPALVTSSAAPRSGSSYCPPSAQQHRRHRHRCNPVLILTIAGAPPILVNLGVVLGGVRRQPPVPTRDAGKRAAAAGDGTGRTRPSVPMREAEESPPPPPPYDNDDLLLLRFHPQRSPSLTILTGRGSGRISLPPPHPRRRLPTTAIVVVCVVRPRRCIFAAVVATAANARGNSPSALSTAPPSSSPSPLLLSSSSSSHGDGDGNSAIVVVFVVLIVDIVDTPSSPSLLRPSLTTPGRRCERQRQRGDGEKAPAATATAVAAMTTTWAG